MTNNIPCTLTPTTEIWGKGIIFGSTPNPLQRYRAMGARTTMEYIYGVSKQQRTTEDPPLIVITEQKRYGS